MPAKFIHLGEPAHDAERQALRFLVDGLPNTFTVYGNPWVVERSGVVYETDAVVVAPHAVFVVEMKAYRGAIEGTDYDWYTPNPIKSPIGLNRKTAQVLNGMMKRASYEAGQIWTQGLVFLSAATACNVQGPASRDRIHTRRTILAALQDPAFITRIASRAITPNTPSTEAALHRVLTSEDTAPKRSRPARTVREYEVERALETHDSCKELLAKNTLSGDQRVLRIYNVPPLASDDERDRIHKRARWEAQVLGRLGKCEGILSADPPFADEAGIVLPLEYFESVTLATWVTRYAMTKKADLKARVGLWLEIAAAVAEAHEQGVVHRLLRPEVVLVQDKPQPTEIRVTGFDLAKQLTTDSTIGFTTLGDERLKFAAPEVVTAFSTAEPASDQFSLGALLAMLVAGRPLFDSTRELLGSRRLVVRLRDIAPSAPLRLDEAVSRMLALRPTERFPDLDEACAAVRFVREPFAPTLPIVTALKPATPDELQVGARIGADYEVASQLGHGGMAVVYAARHLPSGRTRALKIARDNVPAEEALRGEFQTLAGLDHPNVVRVLDLSNMVEKRLTLVMERVSGENLRHRLMREPPLDAPTRRRYAEDLLGALDYLEQKGITHKDLKPDNLLVGESGLTIIDFSLAQMPTDAAYGGTALYRDPSRPTWTHATDRFSAALCLFELYAGRHAFDGKVPEPGQSPVVRPEDIDPPGLAAFFQKALHPVLEQRFPSAKAMRDALLLALGASVDVDALGPVPDRIDSSTSLRATPLPPRAVNQLARSGISTVGDLIGLSDAQVRALSNLGEKTIRDILTFAAELRTRGLSATASPLHSEPPIVPALVDSPEPLERLTLSAAIRRALDDAKLSTIGAVARQSRRQLGAIDGIGPGRLTQLVKALHKVLEQGTSASAALTSLDDVWEQAALSLTEAQRVAVDRFIGVTQEPEPQGDIAKDLGKHQSTVSLNGTEGLTRLIDAALVDVLDAIEQLLDARGGVALLESVGGRLEEQWLPGAVRGAGLVRLLTKTHNTRIQAFSVDGVDGPVVARPAFDKAGVRAFVGEVQRLASQWPPIESESARRTLAATLPEYQGDPLQLATRLCNDVDFTESGQLFIHPLDPIQSIGFVLERERDGIPLDDLKPRVHQVFGERCPFPEPDHLLEVLRRLECQVQDGRVVAAGADRIQSVSAPAALSSDQPSSLLGGDRPPEVALRDMLRDAATSRGFRMLITPPEKHAEIGRSVAAALGGTYVSLEDAFFRRHGAEIGMLERAEQYAAQRGVLTELADTLWRELIEEHGRAGRVIVLGDTALLALCDALEAPRLLYDTTLDGSVGFWVLIVPGVIHNRQPRFNEDQPLFHLDGVTFPLLEPMPGGPQSPAELS